MCQWWRFNTLCLPHIRPEFFPNSSSEKLRRWWGFITTQRETYSVQAFFWKFKIMKGGNLIIRVVLYCGPHCILYVTLNKLHTILLCCAIPSPTKTKYTTTERQRCLRIHFYIDNFQKHPVFPQTRRFELYTNKTLLTESTAELFCPTWMLIRNASFCIVLTDSAFSHGSWMGRNRGLNERTPSPWNRQAGLIAIQ